MSKAVKIVYYPNGNADVYTSYTGEPKTFKITHTKSFDEITSEAENCDAFGISKEKGQDLK